MGGALSPQGSPPLGGALSPQGSPLKSCMKIFGKNDATRKEKKLIKNNDQALTFP